MREPASVQREKRGFLGETSARAFYAQRYFCTPVCLASEKPNRFLTRHEYETTQKNSNSSSLHAEGREIKFCTFLHQLYYIGTRKCTRYCRQNAGMPSGASLYFLLLRIGRRFSIFDFSICQACRCGHFITCAVYRFGRLLNSRSHVLQNRAHLLTQI